jgi:hypothetical protein
LWNRSKASAPISVRFSFNEACVLIIANAGDLADQ